MYAHNVNEWLEADGRGGFASGTVSTIRTRRYHGLLLAATTPPTGRVMLVNGFEAWVESPAGRVDLTAHHYTGGVIHPRGHDRITTFSHEPWPTWAYELGDGLAIRLEVIVVPPRAAALVRWTLLGEAPDLTLHVRPLISGRDYHALQRENDALNFTTETEPESARLAWRPYPNQPRIVSVTNGVWEQAPTWYRGFHYPAERERGLDDVEDLASPGVLHFSLGRQPAVWVVGTRDLPALHDLDAVIDAERARRLRFPSPLARAADAYLVSRGAGKTIIAGYPWFADWGRDTFIALRGLCLATGRLADARDILMEWAGTVSDGMLPNRFPDGVEPPEYNSIDASLWFVVATGELLTQARTSGEVLSPLDRHRLEGACVAVLEGLARGTRYGIRCDTDGLLACGVPGVQLTWMDAKVGDRVITPRVGKPVEVQALWINALELGARVSARWQPVLARARLAFDARFWNPAANCLYDVVDVDHVPGLNDPTLRPNQVFAVGGLPTPVLIGARARLVVDTIEAALLTPLGLRTLDPRSPAYVPHYQGGPETRDAAYHQGTAWPWLMGAFVEAWLRVRDGAPGARDQARERFLAPLLTHVTEAGLGHVSEIVDAEVPFTPRGCPFQAWSLGEVIRLQQNLTYTY
jgi:predicted glycogen debranching enzyme